MSCKSYIGFNLEDPTCLLGTEGVQELEPDWYCLEFNKGLEHKIFRKKASSAREYFRVTNSEGDESWYIRKLKSEIRSYPTHRHLLENLLQTNVEYVPMSASLLTELIDRLRLLSATHGKAENFTYLYTHPIVYFDLNVKRFMIKMPVAPSKLWTQVPLEVTNYKEDLDIVYNLLENIKSISVFSRSNKNPKILTNQLKEYFSEVPYWLLIRGLVSEEDLRRSGWEGDLNYIPKLIMKLHQV